MLLVIFGAGASYDCADVQNRPPLAKDLVGPAFDSIAVRFPECRAIVDRLRERMDGTTSLELELAELTTESRSKPERRRQLTAFSFYLRRVIEDVTTDVLRATSGYTRYLRLTNFLYDWQRASGEPIRIVTFNYDTILEDALETVFGGWDLGRGLSTFVERDDCRLHKLHGSIHWSRAVKAQAEPFAMMLPATMTHAENGGTFDGEIEPHSPSDQVPDPPVLMVPALAIPMEAKTEFGCPPAHLAALRSDLPAVRRLLIVGWRAAEPHVVDLLWGSDNHVQSGLTPGFSSLIVSGSQDDADQVVTNLGRVIDRSPRQWRLVEPGGFSALIRNRRQHLDGMLRPLP